MLAGPVARLDTASDGDGGMSAADLASPGSGDRSLQAVDVFSSDIDGVEEWVRNQICIYGDGGGDVREQAQRWITFRRRQEGKLGRLPAWAATNVIRRSTNGNVVYNLADFFRDLDANPHEYIGFGD